MSKASWSNANPVYRHHPGPRDSFVVVLADGKRIKLTTVDRYERHTGASESVGATDKAGGESAAHDRFRVYCLRWHQVI